MEEQAAYSKYFYRFNYLDSIRNVNSGVLASLSADCYPAFLDLVTVLDPDESPDTFERHLRAARLGSGYYPQIILKDSSALL